MNFYRINSLILKKYLSESIILALLQELASSGSSQIMGSLHGEISIYSEAVSRGWAGGVPLPYQWGFIPLARRENSRPRRCLFLVIIITVSWQDILGGLASLWFFYSEQILLLIVTISNPHISLSLELLDKQVWIWPFQITWGQWTQDLKSAFFWGSFCPTRLCLKFLEIA